MPKFPLKDWTHCKGSACMRGGIMPNGQMQSFYHDDNHPELPGYFKGMEQIIRERGLWKYNLKAQCDNFKCVEGSTECCCQRLLFMQPDFVGQKSRLQEFIES
jgi:hypothetical protein